MPATWLSVSFFRACGLVLDASKCGRMRLMDCSLNSNLDVFVRGSFEFGIYGGKLLELMFNGWGANLGVIFLVILYT